MSRNAPHLPPRSCRVDTYYRLQNIRWILLFALLAFITGLSATIIATAWIIPQYETTNIFTSNNNHTISNNLPDPFLMKQTEQRWFTIYDKRKKTAEKIYPDESFVGRAAIISSDGWAATFVPDYFYGWEKNWEVVDYQNNIFLVTKIIYDDFSQILYFKIDTQGARVMSFPDWNNLQVGISLWSVSQSGWQENYIKSNEKIKTDKSFSVWNDQYFYLLSDLTNPGDILLDEQGNLLGFLDGDGLVISGWLIEKQINNLLSSEILSYNSFNWKGHMVKVVQDNGVNLNGFYLDYVGKTNSTSTVMVGDVILKINSQTVEAGSLSQIIWLSPDELLVTVWRQIETLDFVVNKEKISL